MADARYFHRNEGLRAVAASQAIRELGPVRWGPDRTFWAYLPSGVWHSADDILHARIVRTLEENYRPAHAQTIRDVLRRDLPDARFLAAAVG